ncbi:MAG TPA: 3-isopropylmalate dehydratase small subunit [Deltaproteobacteria bacterium]|nr:3-isopropylmalate dehydratase small subunit [Deltaproteobacteria bacterium]|tara:strand:- start:101 stop:721 length:621 start_codon:yes stop_codon:yes gene_type:complete
MQPFQTLTATAAKLDQVNVDTDQIIPKQFLKKTERTGFGIHLFHDWRFLDDAGQNLNPDFILNQSRYQGAQILVAGDNFGCGSSREHAPWALLDYGFKSIISPSFADIFYNNCAKNGILLVALPEDSVQQLFTEIEENVGCELTVDLPNQKVQSPKGLEFSFAIDSFVKHRLLNGLDDIGWTLQYQSDIEIFEANYQKQAPWMFVR